MRTFEEAQDLARPEKVVGFFSGSVGSGLPFIREKQKLF
jgi:hypothetical protein